MKNNQFLIISITGLLISLVLGSLAFFNQPVLADLLQKYEGDLPISSPVSNPVSNPISGSDEEETDDNGNTVDETNTLNKTTDNHSGFGAARPWQCTLAEPDYAPTLYQITAAPTSAKLYFTPVLAHTDRYYIAYGYKIGELRFGTEFNFPQSSGAIMYEIKDLLPNTTYAFWVRGANGCMPGNWSNWLTITTPNEGEIVFVN